MSPTIVTSPTEMTELLLECTFKHQIPHAHNLLVSWLCPSPARESCHPLRTEVVLLVVQMHYERLCHVGMWRAARHMVGLMSHLVFDSRISNGCWINLSVALTRVLSKLGPPDGNRMIRWLVEAQRLFREVFVRYYRLIATDRSQRGNGDLVGAFGQCFDGKT
mmetsp:Transcript_62941/g.74453  ORF Transcript_62941/g.74453 Transcript_62941/m.74453 type:complete len:163 (-) Transcript_62941:20-508(-)